VVRSRLGLGEDGQDESALGRNPRGVFFGNGVLSRFAAKLELEHQELAQQGCLIAGRNGCDC
jgi:hypothetical protein